ncbi:MAG: glycosyltransferase [Cryobacterium sp.]|nr:glycosyltransferase [Cryobacterium sp.]
MVNSSPQARGKAKPKEAIAAILPLYNGSRWIEHAIKSVLAQSRQPDEFIVIDDGSTDDGVEIVRNLAKKNPIIRIISQQNAGQSAARNHAISLCKSDWIALIDQDDYWYPNHLEDLIDSVKEHRGLRLGWVYSDFDDIDLDGRMIARNFVEKRRVENPKRDLLEVLREGFIIQPSATLIRKSAILEVGGFDERLSGYEDDDLFLRIFLANYDNAFIEEPTSQWRIHSTSSGASDRMEDSLRIYSNKLIETFPNDRWRGLYYRSDVIAPRFIRTWLQMYVRASRFKNKQKMKLYVREARSLLGYLRTPKRIALSIGLFALRQPFIINRWIASGANETPKRLMLGRRLFRI